MNTFTSSSHTFVEPHSFAKHSSFPIFPSSFSRVSPRKNGKLVCPKLNLVHNLEFGEEKKRVSWWSCRCKKGWYNYNDGDLSLEAEILEFMRTSEKPEFFPSKKELIDAGKIDLIERIKRQGGWLVMGWDLGVDHEDNGFQENGFPKDGVEHQNQSSLTSSSSASTSGITLEVAAEDSGIEGILSGLENERNMNFGFGLREKGDKTFFQSNNCKEESITGDEYDTLEIRDKSSASEKEIDYNAIPILLESLKLELSSIMQTLRFYDDKDLSQEVTNQLLTLLSMLHKGDQTSTDILLKHSDAQELQDEITKARDKSRSIRARVRDAQKMLEEKQKRVEGARKALQQLRTVCIVWPNNASVVLLAGSFDGWTTKRKMERTKSGAFSLDLKLYPGKYEIKFIVDGEWKIDPLRPIVKKKGRENHLLIIT